MAQAWSPSPQLAQAWAPSAASLESVFKVLSDHNHPFVMVGTYALTWMGVPVCTGYVLSSHPLLISCLPLLILPYR